MSATDVLGYAAALLTTLAFAPQAWKTFRTRDVSGISPIGRIGDAAHVPPMREM